MEGKWSGTAKNIQCSHWCPTYIGKRKLVDKGRTGYNPWTPSSNYWNAAYIRFLLQPLSAFKGREDTPFLRSLLPSVSE